MSSHERLTIRIDRGQRPAVTYNQSTSSVQIYVPLDTSVNYQPCQQSVGNGYTVRLQRMQQQYKISMQHTLERKPEFVVFASNLVHKKEIKTTVKEVNTKVEDLTIAGSNLEVSGILKGHNLTFESTVGEFEY
uniref:NPL domain-containing protein n=1 Tax=Caenorhabditis tropicalis TaxID=1561998 RepID=A0A1I7U415_9PELO